MKRTIKRTMTAMLAGLCILFSATAFANGPVWADRDAQLHKIKTVRICPIEYAAGTVSGTEHHMLREYTKKLDDIAFVQGHRPTDFAIPEDAYLVMTVNETASEMREAPGYTVTLPMYSGVEIEDGAYYNEHYSPIYYIEHSVGPQRVYTQTAEAEYILYDSTTHRPIFRYRDVMQSSRSYDENIEETITDFYAELKTAIKQSKKRKRG
ncbi:MAG: hypothetical protein II324_07790 [Selenomonadales bacterium]|nr:hypothetical protein [Selenomonadales bacterium]